MGCIYDSIKSYWYVDGNYICGNPEQTADNWNGGVKLSYPPLNIRIYSPLPSAYIGGNETAEEAFVKVCNGAGATLPKRDTVDKRVVKDVINNTGSVPLTLADIPGEAFPVLNSLPAPNDNDHDGMPNDWETSQGLNKDNASDRNTITPDGYTMLEKYLNSIEFNTPVKYIRIMRKSDSVIEIRWADTYLAEEGFTIERSVNSGEFKLLAEVGKNVSSFTDNTVNATDQYTFRVNVRPVIKL